MGSILTATTSCPAGKVLLGGGGRVYVTGSPNSASVELRSSYPLNVAAWRTVAVVARPLGPGQTMTLQPYVICGQQ
jgi:hypothetical protein